MAMCWHEDGYDGSVVACQSYAGLCDFSVKPYRSSSSHFLPCTTTCFPEGIWFSKLQTAFLVHTKRRGRDDGSMALDESQSSGQGAWVFPVGTERGAPLRARVYKFDPMLFEIVISPSQKFFLDDV